MSRILLLILVLIWMAGPPKESPRDVWPSITLFFAFYAILVLMLGLWSRLLAKRVAADNFHHNVKRFNQVMLGARVLVPIWFTVGVWGLGWGSVIGLMGESMYKSAAGLLLGTMPAFATWMALWWSQYPAERALREQNLLVELDNDLPLYRPPAFRSYFFTNFRLQILFTLVPVAMIVLVRDVITWTVLGIMGKPLNTDWQGLESVASLTAAAVVFLFVPALLARVLNTSPMPDSPLKTRLDSLCKRAGIRYRHILVWNTSNHVGNAAVMGVLPQLRYVLLSDMLLERLSDEEIEAVFAHEMGHVVHKHMIWYAIFFVMATLGAAVLYTRPAVQAEPALLAFVSSALFAGMFLLFGALSRRCERQADVYAARTLEMLRSEAESPAEGTAAPLHGMHGNFGLAGPERTARDIHVGEHGARQFAAALRRVASINNISVNTRSKPAGGFLNMAAYYADAAFDLANNYLHGSITSRMEYVQTLSHDPQRTRHFDKSMFWLYCSLLFALFMSVVFSVTLSMNPKIPADAHGDQLEATRSH